MNLMQRLMIGACGLLAAGAVTGPTDAVEFFEAGLRAALDA